jgi:hypothetical protein
MQSGGLEGQDPETRAFVIVSDDALPVQKPLSVTAHDGAANP